jgi:hypothetical protein
MNASVSLFLLPFGLPFGLPDWPGCQGDSCFGTLLSVAILLNRRLRRRDDLGDWIEPDGVTNRDHYFTGERGVARRHDGCDRDRNVSAVEPAQIGILDDAERVVHGAVHVLLAHGFLSGGLFHAIGRDLGNYLSDIRFL